MRALIFAAGRGNRLRPLTDTCPKPLLDVGGQRLIERHLRALAAARVRDIVINIAYLRESFAPALGDGSAYGVRIQYSDEGEEALETGGGMLHALPRLGDAPFIAVNGDVLTDFDFSRLPSDPPGAAHLVLVPTPADKPHHDFALAGQVDGSALVYADPAMPAAMPLTFAGIGVYRPRLFENWRSALPGEVEATPVGPRFGLTPLLRRAMAQFAVTGECHDGLFSDIGTPERLASARASAPQR